MSKAPKHTQGPAAACCRLFPLLGPMRLVCGPKGLLSFSPAEQKFTEEDLLAPAANELLERGVSELNDYLAGHRTVFTVPLYPQGTDLQKQIWARMRDIPYRKTASYGEIALDLGSPHLARAVGQAARKNPLPLFIPCHRVVAKDGLGGFSLHCRNVKPLLLKESLLRLEREHAGRFSGSEVQKQAD